jgi:hypothetical protein
MQSELEELKSRVSQKYLGKGGIHGVSVRRSSGTLCVYMSPGSGEQHQELLQNLKADAAPFKVQFIEEEPPRAAS